jgi:uncharacterized protein (DUF58 family)
MITDMTSMWWRRATLFVPALVAGWVVAHAHGRPDESFLDVTAPLLVMMWTVVIGLVSLRAYELPKGQRAGSLDVLTATGRSTMWAGAGAIVLAALTGWASLSVLGVIGLAATFAAVIWTALACGPRCWRDATITRTLAPGTVTEGEPVREELRVVGVVIPPGMRWFATGRATPHGVATRYAITSEGSRSTVVLERELGTVPRGVHHVPAMAMWFGDVLGLARTSAVYHGDAELTVLPKPIVVDNVKALLGRGGDAATAVPTTRMPTDGTFRIREYAPGDDTRRIHWVRSLQAGELVVRLPDEVPPAEPSVQLVLDNHLWGTEWLTCRAHHDLLDAMVRVWLGVGKALADTGSRVTLVTAVDLGKGHARTERPMLPRMSRDALKLAARVTWQGSVSLPSLLATRQRGAVTAARQVVIATRPPRTHDDDVTWIVLPDGAWTAAEQSVPSSTLAVLPYPIGSGDNRFERRRAEARRVAMMWTDRSAFSELASWLGVDRRGAFVAMKTARGVALKEMS